MAACPQDGALSPSPVPTLPWGDTNPSQPALPSLSPPFPCLSGQAGKTDSEKHLRGGEEPICSAFPVPPRWLRQVNFPEAPPVPNQIRAVWGGGGFRAAVGSAVGMSSGLCQLPPVPKAPSTRSWPSHPGGATPCPPNPHPPVSQRPQPCFSMCPSGDFGHH